MMASLKHTQRVERDADIDAEMDRGDELLEKLLIRVKDTKNADSGLIRNQAHMKRTKMVMKALKDEDLDESTIIQIKKINGAMNGTAK